MSVLKDIASLIKSVMQFLKNLMSLIKEIMYIIKNWRSILETYLENLIVQQLEKVTETISQKVENVLETSIYDLIFPI